MSEQTSTTQQTAPATEASKTPAQLVAEERAKREAKGQGKKLAPKAEAKGKTSRRTADGASKPTAKSAAPAKPAKGKKAAAPKVERPKEQGGVTVKRNGKLSARDLPCLCGCNQPTTTRDARFLSGHDAKLRQGLLEEELDASALPAVIRPFFERGEDVAGLRLAKGGKRLIDLKAEQD